MRSARCGAGTAIDGGAGAGVGTGDRVRGCNGEALGVAPVADADGAGDDDDAATAVRLVADRCECANDECCFMRDDDCVSSISDADEACVVGVTGAGEVLLAAAAAIAERLSSSTGKSPEYCRYDDDSGSSTDGSDALVL